MILPDVDDARMSENFACTPLTVKLGLASQSSDPRSPSLGSRTQTPGGRIYRLICVPPKILFIKDLAIHLRGGRQQKEFSHMWGGIVGLFIQVVSGGVGGNIAGSALKQYDLGIIGNTIRLSGIGF
jgi:hypothetical protein